MKILVMRMMGFGDVASVLIPAVKLVKKEHPEATIDVLTYGPGIELMQLVPEVNAVLAVSQQQWPDELLPAIDSFMKIADVIIAQQYDLVINLDTWFMPCFLARVLKDSGNKIQGNFINYSIADFFAQLRDQCLTQDYFEKNRFLASTFKNMPDWTVAWWDKFHDTGSYPEFYLRHCCQFGDSIDISLEIAGDEDFRNLAIGKKIVALSFSGSKASKQYASGQQVKELLEAAGHHVWSQFDGTLPLASTLARLKVTDLLITVATSTQWLARLVDCPVLMLPGAMPPIVLGAEAAIEKITACQYCHQTVCEKDIDFACMKPSPEHIFTKAQRLLYPVTE